MTYSCVTLGMHWGFVTMRMSSSSGRREGHFVSRLTFFPSVSLLEMDMRNHFEMRESESEEKERRERRTENTQRQTQR